MIECGETEKLQVLKKVLESVEEVTKFWHVEKGNLTGKRLRRAIEKLSGVANDIKPHFHLLAKPFIRVHGCRKISSLGST